MPNFLQKAYSDETDKVTQYNIANAIASYKVIGSVECTFDQYMRGDTTQLSAIEKKRF